MNSEIQIINLKEHTGSLTELVTMWNNNLVHLFPITQALFARNMLENKHVNQTNSYIALADNNVIGFLISKETGNKEVSSNPSQVWLSVLLVDQKWRRKGVGGKLLDCFEDKITNEQQVLVGTDPYHLFPGIPVEKTETINFF